MSIKKKVDELTSVKEVEIEVLVKDNQDTSVVVDKVEDASVVVDAEKDTDTKNADDETADDELDTDKKQAVKATYDTTEKVAIASTDVVDRHGEKINQEGWDLKNFKKNPVMLWAHDHHEIAVGLCKNIQIQRTGGSPRLVFTPEFHDKTDKAKALKALFEEGWLNSFSVGFIPKEFDGKENMYMKQELLEISAVNVPANPDARMLAYKSLTAKGFDKETLKETLEITDEEVKTEKEVHVEKEIPVEKGPVSDEVDEIQNWEKKHENMSEVRTIWWAFCDTYFDEETPVDDFQKLLKETIDLMSETLTKDKSVGTENSEVLDNIETTGNDNTKPSKSTDEASSQAKTQDNEDTSVAPEKEKRAKQELTKVIIQAADNATSKDADAEKMLKIIKRAAEILASSNKGNK